MNTTHPDAIWLIPPILAVAFLLWVLWKFWKEERKQRRRTNAGQPHFPVSYAEHAGSASAAMIQHVRNPGKTAERQVEHTARG